MTPEELYQKYKGKRGKIPSADYPREFFYGIIVGYNDRFVWPLIMAVITSTHENDMGWKNIRGHNHILDRQNNPLGYTYAEVNDIILIKFGRG